MNECASTEARERRTTLTAHDEAIDAHQAKQHHEIPAQRANVGNIKPLQRLYAALEHRLEARSEREGQLH